MSSTLIFMIGLFISAIGQFALSIIQAPKGMWINTPQGPELGYYRDQKAIDLWRMAQKWGHILTFLGIIINMIGLIPIW